MDVECSAQSLAWNRCPANSGNIYHAVWIVFFLAWHYLTLWAIKHSVVKPITDMFSLPRFQTRGPGKIYLPQLHVLLGQGSKDACHWKALPDLKLGGMYLIVFTGALHAEWQQWQLCDCLPGHKLCWGPWPLLQVKSHFTERPEAPWGGTSQACSSCCRVGFEHRAVTFPPHQGASGFSKVITPSQSPGKAFSSQHEK